MRSTFLALTALAIAFVSAAFAPARPDGDAATIAALTKQADAWDKAIVAKQRPAIEGNMAPEFRAIDGAGTVEDRKTFVDGQMAPKLTIDPYTVEDFDVRLFGDTALLSGRTRMTGRFDGQPFTSHYRYIDIYVKRGGAWQIVSVQITRLAS